MLYEQSSQAGKFGLFYRVLCESYCEIIAVIMYLFLDSTCYSIYMNFMKKSTI